MICCCANAWTFNTKNFSSLSEHTKELSPALVHLTQHAFSILLQLLYKQFPFCFDVSVALQSTFILAWFFYGKVLKNKQTWKHYNQILRKTLLLSGCGIHFSDKLPSVEMQGSQLISCSYFYCIFSLASSGLLLLLLHLYVI